MVVPDARYDEHFHDNPLTTGDPHVVFYAGVPVQDAEGHALGTLCVIDNRPRELAEQKLESLKALAKLVNVHFQLRKTKLDQEEIKKRFLSAQPLVNTIHHEFQNLVTNGQRQNFAQLLQATDSLKEICEKA